MRRLSLVAILPAFAACSLLVDDLSTEPPLVEAPGADAGGAEDAPPGDGGGAPGDEGVVVEEPIDAAPVDPPDADAAGPRFALDCSGTVLCDGFEDRATAAVADAPVGGWNDNHSAGGTTTIVAGNAAAGQQYVAFVSPANAGASTQLLLLGNNTLTFANNANPTVVADFDVHLYRYGTFDPGERRNLVGIWPYSELPDAEHEYAGISISAEKGLHAEVREYASANATTKKDDRFVSFPVTKFARTQWHHVHVEATFARAATGLLRVDVDGTNVATIANVVTRTNASSADKFVFWIGANAAAGTPVLSIRYDNVEVRTR